MKGIGVLESEKVQVRFLGLMVVSSLEYGKTIKDTKVKCEWLTAAFTKASF
jgi:hypothetical protein